MKENRRWSALTLGICILLGLSALGWLLGNAAITFKEYERSVSVKGLSEKEYPADVVIWPIAFIETGNDLGGLYTSLEQSATKIRAFLDKQGIPASGISISPPAITDKSAQSYGDATPPEFRYSGEQTVTVYSKNITAGGLDGGLLSVGLTNAGLRADRHFAFVEICGCRANPAYAC